MNIYIFGALVSSPISTLEIDKSSWVYTLRDRVKLSRLLHMWSGPDHQPGRDFDIILTPIFIDLVLAYLQIILNSI